MVPVWRQASIIRVPLGNWCQTPSICTLTMPFSAARSLGSLSSAVAEGVSLMASKESRTRCFASSGGDARDYVGAFRTRQACFLKKFAGFPRGFSDVSAPWSLGFFEDHEVLPREEILGFQPLQADCRHFAFCLLLGHLVERFDGDFGILRPVFQQENPAARA